MAVAGVLFTAGVSLPGTASSATRQVVVYRCTTPSGEVEYTKVPKVGCVVAAIVQEPVVEAPGRRVEPLGDSRYRSATGREIGAPTQVDTPGAPAGASAQCRDGTYSFSRSRRGTCSHHGGVARWL
jgi:hypothetical protein